MLIISFRHLLSVEDLANLVSNNPTLAEALIRKFVDVDGELFNSQMSVIKLSIISRIVGLIWV